MRPRRSLLVPLACAAACSSSHGSAIDAATSDGNAADARMLDAFYPDAATCTLDVYASSATGSDTAGDGTMASPFASIHKALAVIDASPCPTIQLHLSGSFGAVTGESFPIMFGKDTTTVTGAPGTTIAGASGATIVASAHVTLSSLVITGGSIGVEITGSVHVLGCHISGATAGIGLVSPGLGDLSMGSVVDGNASGVVIGTGTAIAIGQATITNNSGAGVIDADTAPSNNTTVIDGATITNNGSDGVRLSQYARVKLRNTTITGNHGSGIAARGANVMLDLGAGGASGHNTLNTTTARNLGVGLCNQTGNDLTANGNTFSTCPPSTDPSCMNGADITGRVLVSGCTAQ